MKIIFTISFILLTFPLYVGYSYAKKTWMHKKTTHFIVSYTTNTAHLVDRTIKIAHETNTVFADYFDYKFKGKKIISLVLYDDEDRSNGSASTIYPHVFIDCRKTPFLLWRGETNWLRTVLTHELAHIYTIQSIRKPIRMVGMLDIYSESAGIDLGLSSYYEHRMMPLWFVEGIAQIGSYTMRADKWDPYRDMLLYDAIVHNKLLSLKEMARFEGTSREYELVYNQGFDLLLYLMKQYPSVQLTQVCKSIKKIGFSLGIESAYSTSLEDLYEEWKESLGKKYSTSQPINEETPFYNYNVRNQPMIVETMAAANGRFVIANWNHDYTKYDLFMLDDSRKHTFKTVKDVGPYIKYDRQTDSLYFTQKVFHRLNGVEQYDLFSISKDGQKKRITFDSRCIAFDHKKGILVYAAYDKGNTSIIKRAHMLTDTIQTFSYDTSVYYISIHSPDSIILSLGVGNKIQTALLTHDTIDYLWSNCMYDIMDVTSFKDTLFLVSTITGKPMLYWCHFENLNIWYGITKSGAGIRYPSIEFNNNKRHLYYTEYTKGNFRIRFHTSALTTKDPIIVSSDSIQAIDTVQPNYNNIIEQTSLSFIPIVPSFGIAFSVNNSLNMDGTITSYNGMYLHTFLSTKNAQESFEFGFLPRFFFALGTNFVPVAYPSIENFINFKIGLLTFQNEYNSFWRFTEFLVPDSLGPNGEIVYPAFSFVRRNIYREIYAQTEYPLNKKNDISLHYTRQWRDFKTTQSFIDKKYIFEETNTPTLIRKYNTIYNEQIVGLQWKFYSQRSKMNPGHLNNSSVNLSAECQYKGLKYNKKVFDQSIYNTDNLHTIKFLGISSFSKLVKSQRISLSFCADGFFHTNNGLKTTGQFPFGMFTYLGKENYFSGYPPYYLPVLHSIRISPELRFNPLISIMDKVRWFERMHLGVLYEAGVVQYIDSRKKINYPQSVELSFRNSFYIIPARLGRLFLKFALPLHEIISFKHYPAYRIYAGLSL